MGLHRRRAPGDPERRFDADALVLSAGAWTGPLAAFFGVDLPVRARKRDVFVLDSPATLPACPLVIDPRGVWFRPEGTGFLAGAPPRTAAPTPAALPAPVPSAPAVTAALAAVSAEAPRLCLEAGPFAPAEVTAAERGLRELQAPGLAWTQVKSERGGAFIVYQGKFADEAALARRRDELRRAQIPFDEMRSSPDLQPGLSFGRYDNRAAADTALEELRQRGAKATRVVTITPPVTVTLLRVERADGALAARLTQLSLPPAGASFRPCVNPP